MNFYDPENRFDYANKSYDYDALVAANEYLDCRLAPKGTPCAHVMPEA